jgi:hypothetical protein
VMGPNDVLALEALGAPAVGLCAMGVTNEQADKLATFSQETGSIINVMFNCTEEGDMSARLALGDLAQHCAVRLGWSSIMHGGVFRGRKLDSLTSQEWERIRRFFVGPHGRRCERRTTAGDYCL